MSAPSAARREALVWLASRVSAGVLALCVLVHLVTIIVAVRSGLSAQAILARTHASAAWAWFYGVFVLAVAVHAPLGLRTVIAELTRRSSRGLDTLMLLVGLLLLWGGLRAVFAVTAS